VKLNLQTLTHRKLDPEIQQQLLERSITEANRLDDLCNNLLLASQMENRGFQPTVELLDFSQLVQACVDVFQLRVKHAIRASIDPGCHTYGDPLLWRLAVN